MPSLTQEAEPARKASSVTSGGSYRATRSLPMGRLLCAAALLLPVLLSGAQKRPHVAVIGAGFGGWGACKTLLANGCQVTLLDAIPDPSGATPYLTPTGKPFEAGTKGFWADYPNLYALIDELGLKENEVFTPCTNSSFYSPFGLEATAPVFSQSRFPILPSPLGQVLATVGLFERLPLADRASMIGYVNRLLLADSPCVPFPCPASPHVPPLRAPPCPPCPACCTRPSTSPAAKQRSRRTTR